MNNTDMQEQSEASKKILETISREGITPHSKWYWTARNSILWIPGIFTTLIGAYAVSGMLYWFTHIDWQHYAYSHHSGPVYVLITAPVIWLVCFGIFSVVTLYAVKTTAVGYRLRRRNILVGSALGSVLIGIVFYNTAAYVNNSLVAGYQYPTNHSQIRLWHNPKEGRITGSIGSIDLDAHEIQLIDVEGRTWTVTTQQLLVPVTSEILLQKNIRVIGLTPEKNIVTACFILPWEYPLMITEPTTPSEALVDPFEQKERETCKETFAYLQNP